MENMYQINFRVGENEKEILEKIARIKNISLAELSKRFVMKELEQLRVDIAFDLMQEGKISKKKAFKMSGLTYYEFMHEGVKRKVTEKLPEELIESEMNALSKLDITQFLKNNAEEIKKPIL